jgi:oxamate amidohydrolase
VSWDKEFALNSGGRRENMLETARSTRGMVVAPHHLAAESGLAVLREGGNAIEAMIAAAATITAVYPHMNGLGGDNFWLIGDGSALPLAIDACGASAGLATSDFYTSQGLAAIPPRGPLAALTVAGALSGWDAALGIARQWGGRLPLSRLFADAIHYARHGFPVSRSQAACTMAKRAELETQPHFAGLYMPEGRPPAMGEILRLPALATTLERLAEAGLDGFYRGELARETAAALETAGSPLRLEDFERHRALVVKPLAVRAAQATIWNMPPPTQGLASLMILGLFDQLGCKQAESFEHLHGLVEATKQAFLVRDAHVTDPAYQTTDPQRLLDAGALSERSRLIDRYKALPWPQPAQQGDTVWLGAIDGEGRAVSFIQSIYWEFGSGLVLPSLGFSWQNRGVSFDLNPARQNALMPRRRPFHTIHPALAYFDDGRLMPYGTMGGEGQPQTQAAIFTRYAMFGQELQQAITAPRWLLGRTWGDTVVNLRLENRFDPRLVEQLAAAGHDVVLTGPFEEMMGHAGALVLHRSGPMTGVIEGAADPRGDGRPAGF